MLSPGNIQNKEELINFLTQTKEPTMKEEILTNLETIVDDLKDNIVELRELLPDNAGAGIGEIFTGILKEVEQLHSGNEEMNSENTPEDWKAILLTKLALCHNIPEEDFYETYMMDVAGVALEALEAFRKKSADTPEDSKEEKTGRWLS